MVLVPTRELAEQVAKVFISFSAFCAKEINTINLTRKVPDEVQRSLLADLPDIVVTTPARASLNLSTSALSLQGLTHLVIDEADLVLSYGYEEDLQIVAKAVPDGVQKYLMSSTLSTETNTLKDLFCRNPVLLNLDDFKDNRDGMNQYIVKYAKPATDLFKNLTDCISCRCAEEDKFLLIYVIFKLKLIKGKCIVFVGDIDRCYRLKLYLEQFGIRSCVFNSELPVNSRIHIVDEFNKGVYDIIIASDEYEVLDSDQNKKGRAVSIPGYKTLQTSRDPVDDIPVNIVAEVDNHADPAESIEVIELSKRKPRKPAKKNKEYGISRGIDFKNVSCVLNFDLPTTLRSYTHRIGRTARAGKKGMALSFVVPATLYGKHKATSVSTAAQDEDVLTKIIAHQAKKGEEVKPYDFDMKQVDAFRYRMNDALRAVTRVAIREARTRELRQELIKSEKLKRHFEENPDDLHHLRHDGELHAARVQPQLKHVPDYLLPSNGPKGVMGKEIGFVSVKKTTENRIRRARMQNRINGKGRKGAAKKADPLKTFSARGRK